MKSISSLQNPLIKEILLLQDKAKYRKQTEQFIIEGTREIELALAGGYVIETIIYCPNILKNVSATNAFNNVIEVTLAVYQKIAYRESTEGILAIAQTQSLNIQSLVLPQKPLILVAESPEKPGNIGAILRTADAARVDAVIITNPKTDMYNPNVVRASLGCLFTVPIATCTTPEAIAYLQANQVQIFGATLQDSSIYYNEDFTQATALVVGTEATGLTEPFREAAYKNINIPMEGSIDSMNVSVAAAILIFEAKRQRNTIPHAKNTL